MAGAPQNLGDLKHGSVMIKENFEPKKTPDAVTAKPAAWKGFLRGSFAAMNGAAVSHPLDLLKVRLQVQTGGEGVPKLGMGGMASHIVKHEGVPGLYRGLSATLLRQFLYSGTRFGVYDMVKDSLHPGEGNVPMWVKAAAGVIGGGIGAIVGQPAELSLVRMQADSKLPEAERRNYKNVFDALRRVPQEEGFVALYRGCIPTISRAMIVTTCQLGAYDQCKEVLAATNVLAEGPALHFSASFLAGFIASVASNPVDVVKTRIMNMRPGPDGAMPYSGQVHCFQDTIAKEGALALYKGFVPTFTRQAPYVVVMFMTAEQLKKMF